MLRLSLYQVDAFTDRHFGGNPAAVVPLATWLDDALLQAIAAENNLSETAYFVPTQQSHEYELRWFTPTTEVRLCGHATLATAHVLYAHLNYTATAVHFRTQAGILSVEADGDKYRLDFPADPPRPLTNTDEVTAILGLAVEALLVGTDDLLAIVADEATVRAVTPDLLRLQQLSVRGLIVSAPGDEVDFVSRCFYPRYGIAEDPATGSAHTLLTPYWAARLGRNELRAIQASARVGHLDCSLHHDRVRLSGGAVTYLIGKIVGL